MTGFLIKWAVFLGLLLAVFFVGYNYYLGDENEKEQSQQIIAKFKDLGSDVIGLLKSEKGKYEEGKYDDAMSKISSGIALLKDKVSNDSDPGNQLAGQLQDLEHQKAAIEAQIAGLNSQSHSNGLMQSSGSPSADQSSTDSPPSLSLEELEAKIEALAKQTQQMGMSINK